MNCRLVYVAALSFMASIPAGTWIITECFYTIHISQLLVLLAVVIGFSFYALGRNDFLGHTVGRQVSTTLLLILGVFLFLYGGYISFFALDAIEFHVYEPLVLQLWPFDEGVLWSKIFDLVWSSLWIVAGALFIVDWLRVPIKGVKGAMLAATFSLVFWNMTLFEAHTGTGLGRGLLSHYLGYAVYVIGSAGAVLLTIVGLVMLSWDRIRITIKGY